MTIPYRLKFWRGISLGCLSIKIRLTSNEVAYLPCGYLMNSFLLCSVVEYDMPIHAFRTISLSKRASPKGCQCLATLSFVLSVKSLPLLACSQVSRQIAQCIVSAGQLAHRLLTCRFYKSISEKQVGYTAVCAGLK